MPEKIIQPSDEDDISCHFQNEGTGTLICRAAKLTGQYSTNETNPTICFNCEVGKIFRNIGCDSVSPQLRITRADNCIIPRIGSLFCHIRKRSTTLEECKKCNLVIADTTKEILTTVRGLFQALEFYSAYKDIEEARKAFRDGNFKNTITRSISCLESTMKTCHDKLNVTLPNKQQISGLWKSTRNILDFDNIDSTGSTELLLNALNGVVNQLGGLRNSLSDAHGRGIINPEVSESIAELSINVSGTISTIILRRYNQIKEAKNE
jgi:hypothetical protein